MKDSVKSRHLLCKMLVPTPALSEAQYIKWLGRDDQELAISRSQHTHCVCIAALRWILSHADSVL